MPEGNRDIMGGTMRLGARVTKIRENSKAWRLYHESDEISERHRHRYEVNPNLVPLLEERGMQFTGRDISGKSWYICFEV